MKNVYVVIGVTGEYSDKSDWAVKAYTTREAADLHADAAKGYAHALEGRMNGEENLSRMDTEFRVAEKANPYDPNMSMDYTGTDYYVLEVELAETFGGRAVNVPDPYDTCARCGSWHYTHARPEGVARRAGCMTFISEAEMRSRSLAHAKPAVISIRER